MRTEQHTMTCEACGHHETWDGNACNAPSDWGSLSDRSSGAFVFMDLCPACADKAIAAVRKETP